MLFLWSIINFLLKIHVSLSLKFISLLITKCGYSNEWWIIFTPFAPFELVCAVCIQRQKEPFYMEKRKLQFTMLEERKNKHSGNKTWIMEIGDISELKIYSPCYVWEWVRVWVGEERKIPENLIKFLFMEISIFLFLIISFCVAWESGHSIIAWDNWSRREQFNVPC